MGYVDVAIPLVAGALMAAMPQLFTKADPKRLMVRKIGIGLLGVAALYLVIKLLESR